MRLLIHVEGQTEEKFVQEVLAPHLYSCNYHSVAPRIVGNARNRSRGGICSWPTVRRDILRHLHEDPDCVATTMVDYYGMPQENGGAWPGRAAASNEKPPERAAYVQKALFDDLKNEILRPDRFIPFVLMHEFEALLFSDCQLLARGIGREDLQSEFEEVRRQFSTPEDINDSPQTAPAKRILKILPSYEKPLFGNLAVLEIGLAAIRRECPHFHRWLLALEARPGMWRQSDNCLLAK